jgi:hypothetical protein
VGTWPLPLPVMLSRLGVLVKVSFPPPEVGVHKRSSNPADYVCKIEKKYWFEKNPGANGLSTARMPSGGHIQRNGLCAKGLCHTQRLAQPAIPIQNTRTGGIDQCCRYSGESPKHPEELRRPPSGKASLRRKRFKTLRHWIN